MMAAVLALAIFFCDSFVAEAAGNISIATASVKTYGNGDGTVTIKWNPVSGATDYEISVNSRRYITKETQTVIFLSQVHHFFIG